MTPALIHELAAKKMIAVQTLLNLTTVGYYDLKFMLQDPDLSVGDLTITHNSGLVINGLFQVYLQNQEVYTALYSSENVLIFEQPSANFLNILKLFLLARP